QRNTSSDYAGGLQSKQVRGFKRKRVREAVDNTDYEYGKYIWERAARHAVAGNCAEMAYVSAYLAIDLLNIPADRVWIGTIRPPGDHACCLISDGAEPAWPTVNDMATYANEERRAVIIDPWLHVASRVIDYPYRARQTLVKWHLDNKRIYWKGKHGNK